MKLKWFVLVCALAFSDAALATIYYVDPSDGLDANAGTSEGAAWKTLSKVGTVSSGFAAGDVVKFRRGQVVVPDATTGTMTIAANGSAGNPITFTNYTKLGDPDGLPVPILDLGNVAITGGWVEQSANGLPGVYYNSYAGSVVNGLFVSRRWVPHASALTNMATDTFWWNSASNSYYAINNSYAVGIYWRPASTDNPSTAITRKASNSQGVVVTNRAYLTFDGLQFEGGYRCIYGDSSSAAITNIIVKNSVFKECRFASTIQGAASRPTVAIRHENNHVSYSGRGLYVGTGTGTGSETTTGSQWINNVASVIGESRWETFLGVVDKEAFSAQNTVNAEFTGNILTDSPRGHCIVLWSHTASGDISGTVIRRNQCAGMIDGIVVGAAVGSTTLGNNRVYGNVIQTCTGFGIKMNISGTSQNYAANNVISRCNIHLYTQGSGSGANNWNIINNMSLNPTTHHISIGDVSTSKPDYNNYYPSGATLWAEGGTPTDFAGFKAAVTTNGVSGPDANSNVTYPVPVSATDFRLAAESPIGKAGKWWSNECTDVRGRPCFVPPDIGAYQSGSGDIAGVRTIR